MAIGRLARGLHQPQNIPFAILLRRLDEGIVDNRRIYLENRLIVRDTVKQIG